MLKFKTAAAAHSRLQPNLASPQTSIAQNDLRIKGMDDQDEAVTVQRAILDYVLPSYWRRVVWAKVRPQACAANGTVLLQGASKAMC